LELPPTEKNESKMNLQHRLPCGSSADDTDYIEALLRRGSQLMTRAALMMVPDSSQNEQQFLVCV
jgi:hypothetical protein